MSRWWLWTPFLFFCLALLLRADDGTKAKRSGTVIFPDIVPLKPGGGLSVRTPVGRPPALKGVRSWTIETRRHRWAATDLAVTPDGRLVATGGYDGMVRLWDAATGNLVRVLVGHDSYVYGLSFSSDGKYLASGGSFDYTVRIWETQTGLPVRTLRGLEGPPVVTAWSADGTFLAAGTSSSGYVHVWRAANGTEVKKLGNGKSVLGLSFAPDGETLACGVSEVGVNLLTAPTWNSTGKIELPGQAPRGLSWSADSKQLAAGTSSEIHLWDAAEKKITRRLEGGGHALARQGNRLAALGGMGKVWDLDSGKAIATLPAGQAMGWGAEAKTLHLLQGDEVVRVDPVEGKESLRFRVAESGTVLWQPSRPILTGLGTTTPKLWDMNTGKLLHTLEGHTAAVTVAAWSPGGKVLATGGGDRAVRVWNPATGKSLRSLAGIEGAVTALAIAGDGKIAVGSADKKVHVFAPETVKPLETFTGHTDAVRALAWGRDGRLASGGLDAAVRIWALGSSKPVRSLEHAGSVECLAYAPNGKLLAAGASEHRVWVWTVPAGKLVHEFENLGSPPAVTSLAWSPDSTQLISGRGNHTVQLWDLKLGKDRHSLTTMAPVTSVASAAGGKVMVTSTLDRTVRMWNAGTGKILTTIVAEQDHLTCITVDGAYRVSEGVTPALAFVVLTATGMDTLSPAEFTKKYGLKNNPTRARMTGN